jgi:hypothetical protein
VTENVRLAGENSELATENAGQTGSDSCLSAGRPIPVDGEDRRKDAAQSRGLFAACAVHLTSRMMRGLRGVAAGALLVAPCACNVLVGVGAALQPYYSSGALGREYASSTHAIETVGCVDLALDVVAGEPTVLEWRMGNRCNATVRTDLSRAVVSAYRKGGGQTPASFIDPNGEIGPHDLAPRREAFERIALRVGDADGDVVELCVDVRAVAPLEGSSPPPACFARAAGRYVSVRGGS